MVSDAVTTRSSRAIIVPLPQTIELDARKVALGDRLFHDRRLSRDDSTACASCHDLNTNGADVGRFSEGWDGGLTTANTPTVFNCAFNFVQFWDGRAATLEEQVAFPIHNPVEMGSDWRAVLRKLRADRDIGDQFAAIYADGLTATNIQDAIATFERSLITPNSRFDKFLNGDYAAITAEETRGYSLFKSLGCAACHQGQNIGGNLFQRLGIFHDYFSRDTTAKSDLGRYNVTHDERDRYVFKVPSLRNVELTAPYLHDGSVASLHDVVRIMAYHQLGLKLGKADTDSLVAFLKTLTGEPSRGRP